MVLRRWLALLSLILPLLVAGCAHETAAEHAANQYAAQEMAAAPLHGNLPDYSLPPGKLAKAQHLAAVRVTTHFADEIWGVVYLILLLWLGVIAWMRDRAVRMGNNRWLQGFSFLLLFLIATTLLELPLDLYRQHLSLKYGLSVQGWASWFGDIGKSFLLTWLFGGLLVMLLFWVIRKLPRRWWLAFWAAMIPVGIFAVFAMPYIEPLFNHYEPLMKTHPSLVARLEQVAQRGHMNIPPDRMFLMKASAKYTTLNADVEGFGHSKRVVVWDTSISSATPDEILFIFGHESGHYVLHHIVRGMLLSFAVGFVLLYFGYRLLRWIIARFGARWRIPSQEDWAALAVLLLIFSVFSIVLEPMTDSLSRAQEHAADVYGQEAIHGIVANPQQTVKGAFDVLGETALEDPNPSPFVEFWTYDHPATGRRAAFGVAYNPWAPGMQPKYFKKQ
ncbi:MAG TPA: M48 family metallopeptidase [Candidatus Aquilonibacter sp.]|nr:M48 family metallopeptidase [Candidatus Aquilonibacter sp.]